MATGTLVSSVPKQIDRSCSTTVLARLRSVVCTLQWPGQGKRMDGWMADASKGAALSGIPADITVAAGLLPDSSRRAALPCAGC